MIAVVLAGGVGGAAAATAQAGDNIFYEGTANTTGVWAALPYVLLTQIDIRSLDGHSACTDALSGGGGTSAPACTNSLTSLGGFGGSSLWRAHAYSGWSGNSVLLRARQYYN